MVSKDDVQRYLDAGIAFTSITRARAEELVGELVTSGMFPSTDARARVDELIERSRKGREALVAQIRAEVTSQLGSLGISSLDDLAHEVADIINRTAEAGRAATDRAPGTTSGSKASASNPSGSAGTTPKKAGARTPTATGAAEAATTEARSTKAATTKAAGTKAAGTKAAGTKAATTKARSTKAATTKAAGTKAATTKARSTKAATTKAGSRKKAAADPAPDARAPTSGTAD